MEWIVEAVPYNRLFHAGTLAYRVGISRVLCRVVRCCLGRFSRHATFESKLETIHRAGMESLVHKLARYRPYGLTSMRGFISVDSIRSTDSYRVLERWTYLFSGSPLERS